MRCYFTFDYSTSTWKTKTIWKFLEGLKSWLEKWSHIWFCTVKTTIMWVQSEFKTFQAKWQDLLSK